MSYPISSAQQIAALYFPRVFKGSVSVPAGQTDYEILLDLSPEGTTLYLGEVRFTLPSSVTLKAAYIRFFRSVEYGAPPRLVAEEDLLPAFELVGENYVLSPSSFSTGGSLELAFTGWRLVVDSSTGGNLDYLVLASSSLIHYV